MKIPIVDESDNIISYMDRDDRDENSIYRISYLWVTDTEGKILLAKRALNKKHDPGKWGPAVAGTVEENETYEENIIKESQEELGLVNIQPILGKKQRVSTKYQYFSQEFLLILPSGFNDFTVQENEVAEVKWFTEEELKKEIKDNPNLFLNGVRERMSM